MPTSGLLSGEETNPILPFISPKQAVALTACRGLGDLICKLLEPDDHVVKISPEMARSAVLIYRVRGSTAAHT